MKEQLITFETATLAKEKRFGWNCRFLYKSTEDGWEEGQGVDYNWNNFDSYSAPTQSLLQKWLREIHKIIIDVYSWIDHAADCNDDYEYKLYVNHKVIYVHFKTYEEALEVGLQEALKLIK